MTKISTQHLDLLPDIDRLKGLLQSLATLDLIMSPDDWASRYFSFNTNWAPSEQMGSMRDGCGDEFFALFNSAGCFIKGFAHESKMSSFKSTPPAAWPRMLDELPVEFTDASNEPAFAMDSISFCFWRSYDENAWSHGPIDFPDGDDVDGSATLLEILDGKASTYCQYAEDYFEVTLPMASIQHVYDLSPLTQSVVTSLNPEANLNELTDGLAEIGYKNLSDQIINS